MNSIRVIFCSGFLSTSQQTDMLIRTLSHYAASALFLLFSAPFTSAEPASGFSTGPVPDWVEPVQYQTPDNPPEAHGGIRYQLVDGQWRGGDAQPRQRFRHFREEILNQAGLEQESELYLYHNQDYQTLTLHQVDIIRDGQRIDKLPGLLINSFRSEDQANNLIYSGGITTHLIVDDLRVGDVLEYSYSTSGSNPVYQDLYAIEFRLSWGIPVEQVKYRLLWAGDEALFPHYRNTGLEFDEQQLNGLREYRIGAANTAPIANNTEKPGWYDGASYAFLANFSQWSDIENWALPMYQTAYSRSDVIKRIADDIRRQHPQPDAQVAAALAYVQDEIRYMGLEMGQNSHRPTAADETLQLRYGDCKDKTVLFVSLLQALNIRAWPALVNTEIGPDLRSFAPSHRLFDHVITYVELNGQSYWLDPTRRNQGDDLATIYQPYYGYALVIGRGDNTLRAMQPDSGSLLSIRDDFYLNNDVSEPVAYTTVSTLSGWFAENFLNRLERSNSEELNRSYLNFYQYYYPGTEISAPLTFIHEGSALITTEEYRIKDFWEPVRNRFEQTFYPGTISDYFDRPKEKDRSTPFAITYPNRIDQVIQVHFADDNWYFDDDEFREDNDFFNYRRSVTFDKEGRSLTLAYSYQALADHVPAERTAEYTAAVNRALDETSYGIFQHGPESAAPAASSAEEVEEETLEAADIVLIIACVAALLTGIVLTSWFMAMGKETADDHAYYPLPVWQFVLLYCVTFSLYQLFWIYRNWQYIRIKDLSAIKPALRTIFGIFFFYPLYRRISRDYQASGKNSVLASLGAAIVLTLVFVLAAILDRVTGTLTSLLLPLIALLPALILVNQQNKDEPSRLHWRHALLGVMTIPLLLLTLAQDMYLIPVGSVVSGDKLSDKDRLFMARNGVLPADENLLYFYSDAFLDLRKDGNGFSEESVFSYWQDDNAALTSRQAQLADVADIRVKYSKKWNENTLITIVTDDGAEFVLYVDKTDKRDRLFVNALQAQWHKKRHNDDGEDSHQPGSGAD